MTRKAQKTCYIRTFGCQMNEYDSEVLESILSAHGYMITSNPEEANLAVVNTCSVRDHAEIKALSRLGALKKPKARRPEMVVGVIGCMAERDPDGIFAKAPHVDLVCGPARGGCLRLPLGCCGGRFLLRAGRWSMSMSVELEFADRL